MLHTGHAYLRSMAPSLFVSRYFMIMSMAELLTGIPCFCKEIPNVLTCLRTWHIRQSNHISINFGVQLKSSFQRLSINHRFVPIFFIVLKIKKLNWQSSKIFLHFITNRHMDRTCRCFKKGDEMGHCKKIANLWLPLGAGLFAKKHSATCRLVNLVKSILLQSTT